MSKSSLPFQQPESSVIGQIKVAFWNLQNLFDIEASQLASDLEFTPVHGWDRDTFEQKVRNLADVIRQMFNGQGPDLLGICEVENERVANMLVQAIGRDDYAVAHVEHPDIRGIDTSLIYSKKIFDFDKEKTKGHLVHLRYPTRDIFEVHLRVKQNESDLVVLVNHWPSRRAGRLESEPFRLTVASHCGKLVDDNLKLDRHQYLKLKDSDLSLFRLNNAWDRNVLVMGDLNDEPWDRSVREILRSGYSVDHIEEPIRYSRGCLPSFRSYASKNASLFNPMWSLMNRPDQGTHYYSKSVQTMNILDQFVLSRGLYFGLQGLQVHQLNSMVPDVDVFRPEIMCTRKGRPRSFDRDNKSGFSDHFPILTTMDVLNHAATSGRDSSLQDAA
ncbi:MAG: endonuclease/exonuclease/phosphatase family protein [Fuerstiella sp.]